MSIVYFVSSKIGKKKSLQEKLSDLIKSAGIDFISPGDLVGIKLSFGEGGNTTYLRPIFVKRIVDIIKSRNAKPFLTETNTLYHGRRTNSVDHLTLALEHGFSFAQVGAPIVIADGLRSQSTTEINVGLKHFKTVKLGSIVKEMDALISAAHFKAHMVTGFGGAIKNIGMGLASRAMKQLMHSSSVRPEHKSIDCCTGCGRCVAVCNYAAIWIENGKAHFNYEKCVGCADCIPACPYGCLKILWSEKPETLGEKMVEVVYGFEKVIKGKTLYINFLLDITPDCDCFPYSDNPIVPNIGITASHDPVALDMASADLVNAQESITGSRIGRIGKKNDKFKALYPDLDWKRQLKYAQEIGLGNCEYTLVDIEKR